MNVNVKIKFYGKTASGKSQLLMKISEFLIKEGYVVKDDNKNPHRITVTKS